MEEDSTQDRIGQLLREGFGAIPGSEGEYLVRLGGTLRPWEIVVHRSHGWLCLRVFVMTLPDSPSVRGNILDFVMCLNGGMSTAKFSTAWGWLCIDAEYREAHVDAETMENLILLVRSVCESRYLRIVQIASRASTLESLERAYKGG